ncbi:MAG TPA: hypothetical protein PLN85_01875 [archaeon]|nr:hypothetical protein [archaeon]HRT02726.1 hypothetical protein [Candidatus Diapherotrites archaeon]
MEKNVFKAIVKSDVIFTGTKGNGSVYTLHQVEILDGILKGIQVSGTRTILNSRGEEKKPVSIGQEVIVYHTVAPKTNGEGFKHFFEISESNHTASDDEITKLLAGITVPNV